MKITEKILNNENPTMIFFGDSLTEGCFEFNKDFTDTTFKPDKSYVNLLKLRINNELHKEVNIINAGKSGNTTFKALKRMKEDVLDKKPDFCLVMLGGNDSVQTYWGNMTLEEYKNNMLEIIHKLKEIDCEVVLMTPSMMATKNKMTLIGTKFEGMAVDVPIVQNEGIMDKFMDTIREIAAYEEIELVDCYKVWKDLVRYGIDVDELLVNDVNHPKEEMHNIFADKIYELLFSK